MKNDLTAEEWIALAYYMEGVAVISNRSNGKTRRFEAYKSAREKFIQTAKEIERGKEKIED